MRIRDDTIAGALSLLAAALVGATWYIYLFATPAYPDSPMTSAIEQLRYTFSAENDLRWWFGFSAALFAGCFAVGLGYLLNFGQSRLGAWFLLTMVCVLSLAALLFINWSLALFVALPAFWGYRGVRGA